MAAKIYTQTGDTRTTGILGGFRISKRSDRIEAIGSLDELNSFLGFLLSLNDVQFKRKHEVHINASFRKIVEQIQTDLFVIGADLSRPMIKANGIPHPLNKHYPREQAPKIPVPTVNHAHVHYLEDLIDHFQANLPTLSNFILPQGNMLGSFLQIIRTICRRTERRVVQLAMHSKVNPMSLAYLNRLSDLFFVLARAVNHESKQSEIIWKSDRLVKK